MQHFCSCPHFSWAELKDLTLFLCTQKTYFSQILFTNLSKSVLVNEIIHPPHRCDISRCWLDSMIIAQVCLRLATIKGHIYIYIYIYIQSGKTGGWRERLHQVWVVSHLTHKLPTREHPNWLQNEIRKDNPKTLQKAGWKMGLLWRITR